MGNPINRREFLAAAATATATTTLARSAVPSENPSLPAPAPWPQDRSAAVSLTFDDAMQTHLDIVGPILKKHGLNGTFFAITGPSSTWLKRPDDWKRLAEEGNEIASHTVNHPCMLKVIKPHSQDYTPEMMLKEMRESSQAIVSRLGVQRGLTFAYPCGDMTFGHQEDLARNQARYLDYVAQFYFAARGYNSWAPVVAEDMNPLTVPVLGWTLGKDFPNLLATLEPARQDHNWGVFVFHGVGGQWLSVTREAFDELAGFLAEHREIWTATFGDVVRYIQEAKALKVQPSDSAGGTFALRLTWPLDAKIYDLPLTLKWKLPPSWGSCSASADGQSLRCSIAADSMGKTALADVPAQARILQIAKR